jgi:[ribosomal protein S5]-alanine N-acetyltransferase
VSFDFERFPTLETERLRLREIMLNDAGGVFRIRSDYQVTRLNTGAAYTHIDQAVALIESLQLGYRAGDELRWGIVYKDAPPQDEDAVIGMVGFNYWNRRDHRASIGYDLARAYWGKGFMPEALRAILRFGFEQMALNRIEADCSEDNTASIRVLEKLGFVREGIQREQYFDEGGYHNLWLFSLLRREWLEQSRAP